MADLLFRVGDLLVQRHHFKAAWSGHLAGKTGKQRSAFGTVLPNRPLTADKVRFFLMLAGAFAPRGG
jgi:hypothetical protein